jgi:transcriptional regulator with XRE-family HTH domain
MRSQVSRNEVSATKSRNLRRLLLETLKESGRIRRGGVGERIKQARVEAGLTQDELADLVGVGMRQIQYYEAGESDPYRRIDKIAEVTNTTAGWLLHGDAISDLLGGDEVASRLGALEERQERVEELLRELLRRLPDGQGDAGAAHG